MFCVLRKTKVLDDSLKLPRPKMTQDVMLIGSKAACMELAEELSVLPENQSTDLIEVEIVVSKYKRQVSHNSKTFTKNNGKRNSRNLS